MLVLRQYVKSKISTNFHVISTYFSNTVSVSEKLTLFQRTLSDITLMAKKVDTILSFFIQINFKRRKIDFVLMFSLYSNFDEKKIDVILKYFVQRSFNWAKNYCHFDV